MTVSLNVHLLPALFSPEDVAGGVVVIVDILRASTTMTMALVNGAIQVTPCLTVDEAIQMRDDLPADACLLGGERGGVKIDGFDHGNSPRAYTPDVVKQKVLAFTTTNGTKAIHHSREADEILIGCFSNLSSVVKHLRHGRKDIHIVCAGTNGDITSEDILFAGCLASRVMDSHSSSFQTSDSTSIAIDHWNSACGEGDFEDLHQAIRASQGGRNLILLGFDEDIRFVSKIDRVQGVARMQADGTLQLVTEA